MTGAPVITFEAIRYMERAYKQGRSNEIRTEYNFEDIIGESAALKRVPHQVETVAPTDSAVPVCGDTGTGKELIARAIHDLSGRRGRTFVKVNCAAMLFLDEVGDIPRSSG